MAVSQPLIAQDSGNVPLTNFEDTLSFFRHLDGREVRFYATNSSVTLARLLFLVFFEATDFLLIFSTVDQSSLSLSPARGESSG